MSDTYPLSSIYKRSKRGECTINSNILATRDMAIAGVVTMQIVILTVLVYTSRGCCGALSSALP